MISNSDKVIVRLDCRAGCSLFCCWFNILQLVSESVKANQAQSSLVSEKQVLEKQLQQVNTSLDSLKTRIDHCEEQVKIKFLLTS